MLRWYELVAHFVTHPLGFLQALLGNPASNPKHIRRNDYALNFSTCCFEASRDTDRCSVQCGASRNCFRFGPGCGKTIRSQFQAVRGVDKLSRRENQTGSGHFRVERVRFCDNEIIAGCAQWIASNWCSNNS